MRKEVTAANFARQSRNQTTEKFHHERYEEHEVEECTIFSPSCPSSASRCGLESTIENLAEPRKCKGIAVQRMQKIAESGLKIRASKSTLRRSQRVSGDILFITESQCVQSRTLFRRFAHSAKSFNDHNLELSELVNEDENAVSNRLFVLKNKPVDV